MFRKVYGGKDNNYIPNIHHHKSFFFHFKYANDYIKKRAKKKGFHACRFTAYTKVPDRETKPFLYIPIYIPY